jgi:hypothetical protein
MAFVPTGKPGIRRFSFVNAGKLTIKIRDARLTSLACSDHSTLQNRVQRGKKVKVYPEDWE